MSKFIGDIHDARALIGCLERTSLPIQNVFCPTGPGGGIDATCSPSVGGGTSSGGEFAGLSRPHDEHVRFTTGPSLAGDKGASIRVEGGRIDVQHETKWSPRKQSVIDFVVDEEKHGQGIGDKLLKEALRQHDDLGGQVSSLASLKVFYNNGFRNPDMSGGTFADHVKEYKDNVGSIYMAHKDDNGRSYVPVQNSEDQPRDEHGRWVSAASSGAVTHQDIDAAGLPKSVSDRAHGALGRYERGEEIGKAYQESLARQSGLVKSITPIQFKLLSGRAKAREATAEPMPDGLSHVDALRELYDRAGDLRTTYDQVEEHVGKLSKLPGHEVILVARELGISSGIGTKAGALRRIEERISTRLGSAQRGAEIEAAARGSIQNVFCATGKGGGVDATCSPGEGAGSSVPPPVESVSGEVLRQSYMAPENRAEANHLAARIRAVVQDIAATRSTKRISSKSEERRGGSTGSSGMCNPVAGAICRLFPNAEVWDGNYDNDPEEFGGHTIFKLGGFFFDVTADQFGREPIAVFAASAAGRPDEGEDSAWPYRGFSRHEAAHYAGPIVDEISERLKRIV